MQRIINFIIRNQSFLLFLLLFLLSVFFTIQSHSYHKSKFINSANFLSGGIYDGANSISQYFGLRKENEVLIEENNRLKSIMFNSETNGSETTSIDTISYDTKYRLTSAAVIKNSYSLTTNMLLIDKGVNDGLKEDLGVITSKGIIGIIENLSGNYSSVISILNSNSRINAQLKKSDHFGTLEWNTESPVFVQLVDMPKIAPVSVGDTIITGGRSTIFPKGIPIGKVTDFKLDLAEDFYTIQVELFNDMTNIGHVFVIENLDTEEIMNLLENDE
ncbi:MAG: rod shape-determining protein MreC [Bacteroidia bacterium]|nr:rod shape-determining protein MreC [Bacteroidia bacterium]NND10543.1 rod shape-determining protein MreC [Flavobacteriaceae bacterium]MBT8309982.1 rod shape-determining protein MreC [Bacteroidia bacterium]NNK27576.1 rod shape-determining protein MreC [Flavobacteriaceae bacterium]NNL61672.1 rod shape-determining protein MreC [Flavobacteriaceae bacterium]